MNRPIRTLAIGCLALFTMLLVNISYIQGYRADGLNREAQNKRARDADCSRKRGPILVDGESIARSVASNDRLDYIRRYPQGRLYSPVTGRFSCAILSTGIEQSENSVLSGSDESLFVSRVVDLFGNKPPEGGSVNLTLDPEAQQAAYDGLLALGPDTQGAVVALSPRTGAVLAMASTPTYDPNILAGHDFGRVQDRFDQLEDDPDRPLINRATQERLPPGSTFKVIVSAAALENGYSPESTVRGGSVFDVPQTTSDIRNEGGGNCGGDRITLSQALAVSCNVAYADLGLKLRDIDKDLVLDKARDFGFGETYLDGELPMAESVYPAELNEPQTAQSSIGQFDVAATPLQMAMVAAAIANDGDLMKPYLVAEERSPSLKLLNDADPEVLHQAVSPEVAGDLTQMMVDVVQDGTGQGRLEIPGVTVAGKTGTANTTPDAPPYAWVIAFDSSDNPKVAVAVLVQRSTTDRGDISGGGTAGPIAVGVMKAVLGT